MSDSDLGLHERLLSGDPTAPAEIAETYLPSLVAYMTSRFPRTGDPHLAETAADDAMLDFLRRPEKYDPTKMDLHRYLRMSARYDLLNLVARQKRQLPPEGVRIVELDAPGAEHEVRDDTALSVEEQTAILASPVWQQLRAIVPNPTDQEIVLLMMEDVRPTSQYAAVLGITHLPPKEQARAVKRNKDRLKKWLQRHMHRPELANGD
jgi:DNA-directed RNA polymerase specialized sigma24 family protein